VESKDFEFLCFGKSISGGFYLVEQIKQRLNKKQNEKKDWVASLTLAIRT
tara:strand:- start:150 stop:299 length:150 start_codon:yes stop_codon:yes gene_type:complete